MGSPVFDCGRPTGSLPLSQRIAEKRGDLRRLILPQDPLERSTSQYPVPCKNFIPGPTSDLANPLRPT